MAEVEKIFLRAAAMAEACGLGGVDAAILLCSLLSLKVDGARFESLRIGGQSITRRFKMWYNVQQKGSGAFYEHTDPDRVGLLRLCRGGGGDAEDIR